MSMISPVVALTLMTTFRFGRGVPASSSKRTKVAFCDPVVTGWLTRIRVGGGWNVMTAVVGPGDLNGDRKSDVVARDTSGTLWLYRGRGNWLHRVQAGGGWNAKGTIGGRGDFSGDGKNDVLAVDAAGVL